MQYINEPQHDKTNKWPVRLTKTQNSLGICPVWSVFAMCSLVAMGPRFLHAVSENSDQTVRMPRLIWVFAGHIGHFVGFIVLWLFCDLSKCQNKSFVLYFLSRFSFFLPFALSLEIMPRTYKWAGPWENVSYVICEQQRRRSACASAQSDQCLCCSLLS